MSIRPPMFSGRDSGLRPNLITVSSNAAGEIDLRDEFDKIVFGPAKDGVGGHGHLCVVRRQRLDALGHPVLCQCSTSQASKQGNPTCQYCNGEGFLWDEEWKMTYRMFIGADGGKASRFVRMPSGQIHADTVVFFFRYDTNLKYGDKIVEVALDEEGDVIKNSNNTYIRRAIYKPQTVVPYRADNGRIEYYALYCREEDAIRNDNNPS